jgi:hypothetical protein
MLTTYKITKTHPSGHFMSGNRSKQQLFTSKYPHIHQCTEGTVEKEQTNEERRSKEEKSRGNSKKRNEEINVSD